MSAQLTVYFAAALFSARETLFNRLLCTKLEARGHKILLPQRDGFEFGQLLQILQKYLSPEDSSDAMKVVIYLLDIGIFVWDSHIILANFDEPIDEGVVTEVVLGKELGKYILGYRTDIRSPYGELHDPLRGMHFFPAYQCHAILWHPPTRGNEELDLDRLADKLDATIETVKSFPPKDCMSSHSNHIRDIRIRAETLFHGIPNIHSDSGIEEIVKRYLQNKPYLLEIAPLILK